MRAIAISRVAAATQAAAAQGGAAGHTAAAGRTDATGGTAARRTEFTVTDATAEHTGLPGGCADIVTASQAMHWFDADRALPEIARVLRPGGVLAAYDCDWPPCIDWETDAPTRPPRSASATWKPRAG